MPNKFSDTGGTDFDDVMLLPARGNLGNADVSTKTRIADRFHLNIPLISSALDTVTEWEMAAAMARAGGLGVIHRNMPAGKQVEEVRKVKRLESKVIEKPIVISHLSPLAEADDLMRNFKISGLPVIDETQKVIGILTRRDIKFADDLTQPVSARMTSENLVTASADIDPADARKMMYEHRVEKLVVLDDQGRCAGLVTVKDIENMNVNPDATRDTKGRLKVAAAVGVGKEGYDRAQALADAEVDIVFVDVANGHHQDVLTVVNKIAQLQSSRIKVVAGNVVTAEGARALIENGAHAIKVGVAGRYAGVGVPSLTAIMDVADACSMTGVPVIADGNLRSSADIAKALAAGADAVMLTNLLAGCDEAPGHIIYEDRNTYKVAERTQNNELRRPSYKGRTHDVLGYLLNGLKQAMVETGSGDIEALKYGTRFMRRNYYGEETETL